MVEFALVLPVFLLLFATVLDLGRIAAAQIAVNNAAREGAFQAASTPTSYVSGAACDQATNLVTCRVQLEAKGSVVSVAPADISMACSPSCTSGLGNTVTVSVTGHFQLLTTLLSSFVGGSQNVAFTASATNQIETLPAPPATSTAPPALTVPSAPQNLSATAGDTSVSLAWAAPTSDGGSAITGYLVYRGTTPGGEGATPVAAVTSGTTFTDTGLTNGTTYYYEVAAVNGVGSGPVSSEASATPMSTATPTPTPPCLPPSAGFTYTATPTIPAPAPVTVQVVDTSTPAGTGCITTWTWNWGDGTISTGQVPNTNPAGQHTYAVKGNYFITLQVTGPAGTNTSGKVKITVQ